MKAQAKNPLPEGRTHLTRTVHEISLMISRIFNRRVKEVGLTRVQWQTLYLLCSRDGLTQTELAECLAMTKPSLGQVVDRLEAEGWVERRDDPEDRRANLVFLTDKATPLIPQMELLLNEIVDTSMSGMHQKDRNTLFALLDVVHSNLNAAVGPDDATR